MTRHGAAACILASSALLTTPLRDAHAQQPRVFAQGDPAAGKILAERDCVACHQSRFGDAARIYTRAERKVRTAEQLAAQVSFCNTQLKTNYFPDEEAHVAAYLNLQYYHFKP
jgi:mono/diheme cytochrome c family protein